MTAAVKCIYASITNHVQLSGFRDIVEVYGKARGLKGLVFNDPDGSVKVMASGPEESIENFIEDLRISRPNTQIDTREIIDEFPLPVPFGRVVTDEIREIGERLDKGVNVLTEHTGLFKGHTAILKENTQVLHSMNEKLETIPERIAEAFKK
jgi:acylphosphatase